MGHLSKKPVNQNYQKQIFGFKIKKIQLFSFKSYVSFCSAEVVCFKLYSNLHYFRKDSPFKIVKYIKMYRSSLLKCPVLTVKCVQGLQLRWILYGSASA